MDVRSQGEGEGNNKMQYLDTQQRVRTTAEPFSSTFTTSTVAIQISRCTRPPPPCFVSQCIHYPCIRPISCGNMHTPSSQAANKNIPFPASQTIYAPHTTRLAKRSAEKNHRLSRPCVPGRRKRRKSPVATPCQCKNGTISYMAMNTKHNTKTQ